ncbi:cyclin-dependent kinase inhibitor 3 [Poecilia reticulata]|uniref:cyclin-dependent kinase inhibitor 3 n=1 Tax=Poecilia reticulata TaxID=8081 RepID=UPI0007EB13EB|nr:PREDICTED: cyclin-dependent kinase inhibitor 3 [Poecilia reticulata]
MRKTEFDSSSDEDVEEEQLTPLHISWLPLSIVECSQYLGICALPGCKYKDVRRSLQRDVGKAVFEESLLKSDIKAAVCNCLEGNRKTVVHCYGGLGRSALIAACLLLQLSVTMTANEAIEILREHRGGGAIQTVKQYNFLHEFREKYAAYKESREASTERSVSR